MKLAIGLASGLGNCVHMLPVVKALKLMGHPVNLYVETDFPTASLWRRCKYADEVIEAPASLNGHSPICGNWRPQLWRGLQGVMQCQLPQIHACEWRSNWRLAEQLGWHGDPPDVSDWCDGVERVPHWDIGIVPGCKGGTWLRKRYPRMAEIASHFLAHGKRVAVFGQLEDGVMEIPGDHIETPDIAMLPDALAGCRIVIGTDSGLTFLASSLGIPVVMVYTATSEVKASPVGTCRQVATAVPCRPCVSTPRWNQCRDWKCREIDPNQVISAAEELLFGPRGSSAGP